MKQEVVPTSPKSTERHQRSRVSSQTFIPIFIALAFGVAGGVVGSVYTQNIIQSIEDVGSSALFRFSRSSTASTSAMSSVNESIASVYVGGDALFSPDAFVDYAVVMSTDGWLVLSDEHVRTTDGLVVRLYSGAELPVQEVVRRVDLGLVYVRTNRVDLQPITLAHADVNVGSPVTAYASTATRMIYAQESVSMLRPIPEVASSNNFARRFSVNGSVDASAPLFNDNHELLGWRRVNGEIIPVSWIGSGFVRIHVDDEEVADIAYTSVNYVSTSERAIKKYPDAGWLITQDVLGLQKDDVVTAIDGAAINDADDLATAIAQHIPGAEISLTIIRDGVTQHVSITAW
ncbi:MAG: PDZ domain-containing protein [Candidatus Kerfeldbacteria bacterium]|nr:PDZ domain-containing protein [Candidatus Kerfeldbacteria bacterium]